MRSRSLPLCLLFQLALLSSPAHAEEAAAEPLHVIRPLLHTEQEEAELCLEFDHTLDAVSNAARIAALLHLEMGGKAVPVSTKNISFGDDQLCLSALQHRKNYRLTLSALHDGKGEKLSRPYALSFTVPARHPSLAFVNKEGRDGLTLWKDNPVLHSVNNASVTLELYRITDPTHMVEAWNQRLQTTLAPSESLYFARHNGALVWKGEIAPANTGDQNIESIIDFAGQGETNFTPGLYLLAATDADPKPVADDSDKSEHDKANTLTPTAAAWLLRSNLSLEALRNDPSYTVLTEVSDASAPMRNVHVLAMDHDQQILAEAQSDTNGEAVLTPKPDKTNDVQTILGIGDQGDVGFLDASRELIANPALPSMTASLAVDQTLYAPAETIHVTLAAHDLHKRPMILTGSTLQLLRPDRSLYDSQAVTLDTGGMARQSFAAPVANGLWHLVWKAGDGSSLAETPLRVSANPSAPALSLSADHTSLPPDGSVTLTIHSQTGEHAPAPYVAGHIELSWSKATHPFAAWKDYRFDDGKDLDATPHIVGSFLTDANGVAQLHITLPHVEGNESALRQAQIRIISDPSQGALDPPPVLLTIKPIDTVLGLKPLANNGHFPENSMARFMVIAVYGDGHRHAIDDLTYQIYEQGRSFEWYQADGHWDYKPQPQRRRIGGGSLSFTDDGQTSLEWPVASGTYQIEITNADGVLMARDDFKAGWGFAETGNEQTANLDLKPSLPNLQNGKEEKISFNLAHPGLVTAIIADDHIRNVLHGSYPAGANSIAFTPSADWGSRVHVHVQVRYGAEGNAVSETLGQITLASNADALPPTPHATAKPAALARPASFTAPDVTLHDVLRQTLAPQQSWTMGSGKQRGPSVLFLSPEPVFDAPTLLSKTFAQHPFTTQDIARQLMVLRLWHDALLNANLMPEAELHARQDDLLLRLLQRQSDDGGFAPLFGSATSDIVSTATAIEVLNGYGDAATRPMIEQASGWLHHHLENTWFEEAERPQRAEAYAALATIGKLDPASLHYFSDTSAEKNLPPLASAQMAYAFSTINDEPASRFWLDKVRSGGLSFDAATLPVLLANAFFTPHDAEASLEKASKQALEEPDTREASSDFLIALAHFEDRAGTWRVALDKGEKNLHGVLVTAVPEKPGFIVRNPSTTQPLSLVVTSPGEAVANKNGGKRHIYSLDGNEVSGPLKHNATYLVMVEGAWAGDGDTTLLIHENPAPSLIPIGCSIEAPSADSFLGWLAYKAPTPVKICERSADGLDLLIKRGEKESGNWHIAYLAKAVGGDLRVLHPASVEPFAESNPDDKDVRH